MNKLNHPNIVKVKILIQSFLIYSNIVQQSEDIFKRKKTYNGEDFFEQLFLHLPFYLELSQIPRENLSVEAVKILVKQLIEAVNYLHQQKIMHRVLIKYNQFIYFKQYFLLSLNSNKFRYSYFLKFFMNDFHQKLIKRKKNRFRDIKPSNIFLDKSGKLLLGDMGISRDFPQDKNQELTGNTITRLYRPPEILFGGKKYDESVDLWSLGCTIAEFFLEQKRYFFFGKSEIDQLCKVFEVRGSANEEIWPGCTELPFFMDFGDQKPKDLSKLIPKAPRECIEIIDSLLQLCPQKRAKPSEVNQKLYLLKNKWLQSTTEAGQQELKQFAERHIEQNIKKILNPPERK